MTVYLDTSSLIKLVLVEDGSETAAQLWGSLDVGISSRLAYPEARAALAAAERVGRISRRDLGRSRADLDHLFGELHVVEVDAALVGLAGDLAERHALRGYDAVHLASALQVDAEQLTVATWDQELGLAASAEGRPVVPAFAS